MSGLDRQECADCGCHLNAGDICDCLRTQPEERTGYTGPAKSSNARALERIVIKREFKIANKKDFRRRRMCW